MKVSLVKMVGNDSSYHEKKVKFWKRNQGQFQKQILTITVGVKPSRYLKLITREELLQITIMCDDGNVFVIQVYSCGSITDPKWQNSVGIPNLLTLCP